MAQTFPVRKGGKGTTGKGPQWIKSKKLGETGVPDRTKKGRTVAQKLVSRYGK